MDVEALLREVAESPPCGPNLEYDPAFLALEAEAQGKPEQEAGGTVIPAVEPNWALVREQAEALLARSKDLRVAMQLLRGLTRTEDLGGFAAGVELINALLERYWADLHPQLDVEDNNDPTLRLNALAPFEPPQGSGATETLLRDLREANVVPPTAQAQVRVRDILILEGKLQSAAGGQSESAIDGALRSAIEKEAALVDIPAQAIAAAQRLRALVAERVGSELAPDVQAVVDMLKPVRQRLARLAGRETAGASEGASEAAAGPRLSGEIRGREDVSRAIDAICDFLERTEPANPAPLLLRRAQRLLNMNFVELVTDLAPDSVGQVKLIAGLKD